MMHLLWVAYGNPFALNLERHGLMGRQQTRIHYLGVEPLVIPERWFSPAFLARNNLD